MRRREARQATGQLRAPSAPWGSRAGDPAAARWYDEPLNLKGGAEMIDTASFGTKTYLPTLPAPHEREDVGRELRTVLIGERA